MIESTEFLVSGNPTTFDGIAQTFDVNNRLTGHGASWIAGYFSTGHRAWKQTDSSNVATRTYFVYDGDTPILELDSTGQVSAINTFGANGLNSRRASNATVFYALDERGNVAQRMDASGTVLSSHVTDAFGTTVNNPTNTSASPFGFGGQFGYYTDEETGLVLCTHRYYSMKLGRWLTRDPIGYEGGINLYGYVTNNPTNRIDPLGESSLTIYGNDSKGVVWAFPAFVMVKDRGPAMFKPSKKEAIKALIETDSFVFWGHGAELSGAIHLNNETNWDGFLSGTGLDVIICERKRLKKPKMKYVKLYSCFSTGFKDYVNK